MGRTFEYDAWNRLIIARSSGGVLLASYDYDGLNRRITEQVSSDGISDASMSPVKDMFYSSQWQVLEERLRVAGAVGTVSEARFVWSPVYIDAMVLRDRGAERVYALQDGNWNTTALIAAAGVPGKTAGEVIQRMVYNPYGEVFRLNADWTALAGAPLVAWQHLFQGLKFTEATGLGYVRNRDYSPTLGRFIELDPIGFSAGDNNWYRFVGNGTVGRVDPSGLMGFQLSLTTSGTNAWITVTDRCGNVTINPPFPPCSDEDVRRETQSWNQCIAIVFDTYDLTLKGVIADRDQRLAEHDADLERLLNTCALRQDPLEVATCQIGVHHGANIAEEAIWTAFTLKVGALAAARTTEILRCGLKHPCAKKE
jgi:RHS repeat-associated protein